MKKNLYALTALIALSGCKDTNAPFDPPVFRVTATITEENKCFVSAMGKSYESVNQIRGDKPAEFIVEISRRGGVGSRPAVPCPIHPSSDG